MIDHIDKVTDRDSFYHYLHGKAWNLWDDESVQVYIIDPYQKQFLLMDEELLQLHPSCRTKYDIPEMNLEFVGRVWNDYYFMNKHFAKGRIEIMHLRKTDVKHVPVKHYTQRKKGDLYYDR